MKKNDINLLRLVLFCWWWVYKIRLDSNNDLNNNRANMCAFKVNKS